MAKPIALLKFSKDIPTSHFDGDLAAKVLQKRLDDYHVLLIESASIDDLFELQVFYDKDFTEVQYEELKKIVEEALAKPELNNNIPYVPVEDGQTT